MTLERQGFDAVLRISNQLEQSLTNINMVLQWFDQNHAPIQATTDPNETNALFFYRLDRADNIQGITNASISGRQTAELHWLIVPAPGAGGTNAAGKMFYVGAQISYSLLGEDKIVTVEPDFIIVRPMPILVLDYFLPRQVIGDDPFTDLIEPPVPFPLGVRVRNVGAGTARRLSIESAQPEIRDNVLDLLVNFSIEQSDVQGIPSARSLLVDFGDIEGGQSKVARWMMTSTLDGRFVRFVASYTHSDALGGRLTSLLQDVQTHELVKDVRADLPGRDSVYDFLAYSGSTLRVYESEGSDTAVEDKSQDAGVQLTLVEQGSDYVVCALDVPAVTNPFYVRLNWQLAREYRAVSANRSDGKSLDLANVWVSRSREHETDPWQWWFNLFDMDGGGRYWVTLTGEASGQNQPPVLGYIGRRVTREGEFLGFLIEASDPDGTEPAIVAYGLPAGAAITNEGNGRATFYWTPATGQYGVYPVRFEATDGALSDWEVVKIYVGRPGEELCNGIPCSLTNWTVEIKEVLANAQATVATVKWDSVAGVMYDVYYSDDPFSETGRWQRIGGPVAGSGGRDSMADASVGTNIARRYYKVVVSGDEPDRSGLWAIMRGQQDGRYVMWAPPVRTDGRIDGDLGEVLKSWLTGAADGSGDWVFALDAGSGQWRGVYLDEAGVWREANGTPSTLQLEPGQGIYIRRASDADVQWVASGQVGNDGTRTNVLRQGWNLIGLSEGRDLKISEVFAGVAQGGATEESADQLILQTEDGRWRRLMYVEGWGAPYDGKWFDLSTYQVVSTNEVLRPGQAYYYLRRGEAVELRF